MKIEVGPYTFSQTDARKTLVHVDDLLDGFPATAQVALADLRAELNTAAAIGNDDALAEAVAIVFPKLLAARDIAAQAGAIPATAHGSVAQLNVSNGGVPKTPVDTIEVGFGGVTTDRQATRNHHGRPWQALCLWSADVIDALTSDGHPIFPGAAGENITIAGIDWPDVTVGSRLQLGSVLAQVTAHAIPCQQNAQWFSDGDFNRIHHRNGPISRLYAVVLEPGTVGTGDEVILEP